MARSRTEYVAAYIIDDSRAVGPARRIKESLGGAEKSAGSLGKAFAGLAAAGAGLAALRAIISGISSALADYGVQEAAVRQVEAAIKSTGGVSGLTSRELRDMASALQEVTEFGDEVTLMASAQLLTFTKIGKEVFPDVIERAQDLSVRMDQDLRSSIVQLGKALNDPIANLGALGRAGIQFSDEQKETIKTLAETGRLATAQGIILEELESQFGGAARAARDTSQGAFKAFSNASGDLSEAIGARLSPAVRGLTEALLPLVVGVTDWLNRGRDLEELLERSAPLVMEWRKAIGDADDSVEELSERVRSLTSDLADLLEAQTDFLAFQAGGFGGASQATIQRLEEFADAIAEVRRKLEDADLQDAIDDSFDAEKIAVAKRQTEEQSGAVSELKARIEALQAAMKEQRGEAAEAHRERMAALREEQAALEQQQELIEDAPLPFEGGGTTERTFGIDFMPGARSFREFLIESLEEASQFFAEDFVEIPGEFIKTFSDQLYDVAQMFGSALESTVVQAIQTIADGGEIDWKELGADLLRDTGRQIGEYYGGPIGGAIGDLAGKLVGDVLGLGAELEDAYSTVIAEGGQLLVGVQQGSGQAAEIVDEILGAVLGTANAIVEALGGTVDAFLGGGLALQVNVKDGEIREIKAYIDGVAQIFSTIDEAINALVGHVLSLSATSGLEPEVEAVLRSAAGRPLEEIDRVVGAAVRVAAGRVGQHATLIGDRVAGIVADFFDVLVAGGDPVAGTLGRLAALRADIQGEVLSQEEIYQRRKGAFNLELDLLELQLRAKLDELSARGDLLQVEQELTRADLATKGQYIEGLGAVVGATANAAQQIALIAAALDQISELRITDADVPSFSGGGRIDTGRLERERAEAARRELEILRLLVAGHDDVVAAMREGEEIARLMAEGLTEAEAQEQLYLESVLDAAEAAEEARLAWEELSQSLSESAAALLGPGGIEGQIDALIEQYSGLQGEILDALAEAVPGLLSALPSVLSGELGVDDVRDLFGDVAGDLVQDLLDLGVAMDVALEDLGQEGLAGLGSEVLAIEAQSAAAQDQISGLLNNLEALGLTADEVAAAVADAALPDLLRIAESQAARVGDEEKLARFQAQRAEREQILERLKFEALVAQLELAGALDEELQGLVDETRELFDLPTFVDTVGEAGRDFADSVGDAADSFSSAFPALRIVDPSAIPSPLVPPETPAQIEARLGPILGDLVGRIQSFGIETGLEDPFELLREEVLNLADWVFPAFGLSVEELMADIDAAEFAQLMEEWRRAVLGPAEAQLQGLRGLAQTPAQQFLAARAAFQGLDIGSLAGDPEGAQAALDAISAFTAAGQSQFGGAFTGSAGFRDAQRALEAIIGLVPGVEEPPINRAAADLSAVAAALSDPDTMRQQAAAVADPIATTMQTLWGPGSEALGHLARLEAIEAHLQELAGRGNLAAGGTG